MDLRYDQATLTAALNGIESWRWLFANLPLDPLHRDWLRRLAWVRTVHGSTRIEGNTLSVLEVDPPIIRGRGRPIPRSQRGIHAG